MLAVYRQFGVGLVAEGIGIASVDDHLVIIDGFPSSIAESSNGPANSQRANRDDLKESFIDLMYLFVLLYKLEDLRQDRHQTKTLIDLFPRVLFGNGRCGRGRRSNNDRL